MFFIIYIGNTKQINGWVGEKQILLNQKKNKPPSPPPSPLPPPTLSYRSPGRMFMKPGEHPQAGRARNAGVGDETSMRERKGSGKTKAKVGGEQRQFCSGLRDVHQALALLTATRSRQKIPPLLEQVQFSPG